VSALQNINGTIVLAGAGKMGGAMLTGWLARGLDTRQVRGDRALAFPEIGALANKGVRLNPAPQDVEAIEALVIAVKPQSFREAGAALKPFTAASTLVVSIMAARRWLCSKGSAAAAWCAPCPTRRLRSAAASRLRSRPKKSAPRSARLRMHCSPRSDRVEWVEDETLMDAVTAVSGSGPAYVFLLAEELARAGVEAGLPLELANEARTRDRGRLRGIAVPLDLASATLRQNVTSPGWHHGGCAGGADGQDGLQQLMARAVAAATSRRRNWRSKPRHSGMRHLAQARNPYSRSWLWIPDSLVTTRDPE